VHSICSGVPKSQQRHFEAPGAGHYGIFSGRRWREMVYPVVKTFILDHNTQIDAAPKAKPASTPAAAALAAAPQAAVAIAAAPAPQAKAKPATKKAATKTVVQAVAKPVFKTVMAEPKKSAVKK
jgi:poly(3-hydroxybutyrate) depolymerase